MEVLRIKTQKFFYVLFLSFVPALVFCLFLMNGNGIIRLLSDTCAIAGLLCMIVGLWRVTRKLGLFDGIIYSFKKLHEVAHMKEYNPRESKLGQRHEYVMTHPYTQRWHEPLAACGLYIAVALALALFA